MADRQSRIIKIANNYIDLYKVAYVTKVKSNGSKSLPISYYYGIGIDGRELYVEGFEKEKEAIEHMDGFVRAWDMYQSQEIEVHFSSVIDSIGVELIADARKKQIEKGYNAENDLKYFKGSESLLAMADAMITQDLEKMSKYVKYDYAFELIDKKLTERCSIAGAFIAAYLDMKDLQNEKLDTL